MSDPPPVAVRLTAPGRGAVATVRVSGDVGVVEAAGFRPATGKPLGERPIDRIVYGYWGSESAEVREDVVACRTATDATEVHCHGGDAAVGRILDDLRAVGCEVPLHAYESEFDRETWDVVTRATTVRTATLALAQANGRLWSTIDRIAGSTSPDGFVAGVEDLLRHADVGLHLANPWRVVLGGRPNVGKSSLVNALLGYARAIVFDQPGTTRDVVTGETAFDGWPVLLADTAGVRESEDGLERSGIERARARLTDADLQVLLVDTSAPQSGDDHRLLEEWPNAIVVAHKCDLPAAWTPEGAVRVSSVSGEGVEAVIAAIVARLVPDAPAVDAAIPVTHRQVEALRDARSLASEGRREAARQRLVALLCDS